MSACSAAVLLMLAVRDGAGDVCCLMLKSIIITVDTVEWVAFIVLARSTTVLLILSGRDVFCDIAGAIAFVVMFNVELVVWLADLLLPRVYKCKAITLILQLFN